MYKNFGPIFLLLFFITLLGGCNNFKAWVAENFMQDKVSDGSGRLLVQHTSLIMYELNKHFDNENAKIDIIPSSDPQEQGKGTVIWTIEDVSLMHEHETPVYTDCQGEKGLWQGEVIIKKAKKTMYGRLTGDKNKPVIPDLGKLKIEVEEGVAQDLSIRFPKKEGHLKIKKGSLRFAALPRLAQNDTGMRLAPTSNTKFDNIKFADVKAELFTKDINMPVTIDETDLSVQIGEGEDGRVNAIEGTITIFGNTRTMPTDNKGLDPDFDVDKFRATYSCHPELQGAISYSHISIEEKMAPGIAALSAKLLSSSAGLLEEDFDCGLSSDDVISNTVINGDPGQAGSSVAELNRPCLIILKDKQSKPNCFGEAEKITGVIKVLKAKKKMDGMVVSEQSDYKKRAQEYGDALRKGDLELAIKLKPKTLLPASNQPVELSLNIDVEDIEVHSVCLSEGNRSHPLHCKNKNNVETPIFRVKSGSMAAKIRPLVAKSLDEKNPSVNFCAQKTRAGEMKVEIKDLRASIEKNGLTLMAKAYGSFDVVNGRVEDKENQLGGKLYVGNVLVPFKSKDNNFLPLDPAYDAKAFLDSFMSCERMVLASNAQCKPELGLSSNIARLLVQNAGSILKIASSPLIEDSFSSKETILNRRLSDDQQTLFLQAKIDKSIDLQDPKYSLLTKTYDGHGNETSIWGIVEDIHGMMEREGVRTNEPYVAFGINWNMFSNRYLEALNAKYYDKKEIFVKPIKPDSTKISLKAQVRSFATRTLKAHKNSFEPRIKIDRAVFKIDAMPFFGMDARTKNEEHPSFSINTPVVNFEQVEVYDAPLVLKTDSMTIPIYVERASLKAHNGKFKGQGNFIEGAISMKITNDLSVKPPILDELITIPRQDLIPSFPKPYNQKYFDKSYSNTKDLNAPLAHD